MMTARSDRTWRNNAIRSPRPVILTSRESAGSATVALKSRASGAGLKAAMTKRPASFTVVAYNAEGEPVTTGGDPFLVSVRGKSSVHPRVRDPRRTRPSQQ